MKFRKLRIETLMILFALTILGIPLTSVAVDRITATDRDLQMTVQSVYEYSFFRQTCFFFWCSQTNVLAAQVSLISPWLAGNAVVECQGYWHKGDMAKVQIHHSNMWNTNQYILHAKTDPNDDIVSNCGSLNVQLGEW